MSATAAAGPSSAARHPATDPASLTPRAANVSRYFVAVPADHASAARADGGQRVLAGGPLLVHSLSLLYIVSMYSSRLRGGAVRVVLSNSSDSPLYQQVKEQIGAAVLSGELVGGEALPSVRALARDLRISVITTTRAYAELAAEGFITTIPGKGTFVQALDSELVREQRVRHVETALQAALDAARPAGLSRDDLVEILDTLIMAEVQEPI